MAINSYGPIEPGSQGTSTVISVNGQEGVVELGLDDLVNVSNIDTQNEQPLVYNAETQTWGNGIIDAQYGVLSEDFAVEDQQITAGDNLEIVAEKTQGQINGVEAVLGYQQGQLDGLENNAVQSVNGVTAKNFILGNGTNTTVVTTPSGDTVTLVVNVNQATESLIGGLKIATQLQTDLGSADNVVITPLKLAGSILASQVATNTINLNNLQAGAIQTVNGIGANNILNVRDAQGNSFTATDSTLTTIVTVPNASPTISGLIRPGNTALQPSIDDPLVWDVPFSQSGNFLQNAQFNIWQRGTTFNITTQAKTFTSDRWWIDTQTGSFVGTINVQRNPTNNSVPGGYAGTNTRYRASIAISGYTSGTAYLCQSIENVLSVVGPVTFTVGINFPTNTVFPVEVVQYYGTGGSPSATRVVALGTLNYTGSSSIQNLIITGNITSNVSQVLGTNNDSCLVLRIRLPQANGTVLLGNPQLQRGIVSSGLDFVFPSVDLANCMRYYQAVRSAYSGSITSGSSYISVTNLPVPMQRTPTVISYTGIANNGFEAGSTSTITLVNNVLVQETRAATATTTQGAFRGDVTLSAELTY